MEVVRRTPTSATLRRSTVLRRHRTGLLDALLPARGFTVVDSAAGQAFFAKPEKERALLGILGCPRWEWSESRLGWRCS